MSIITGSRLAVLEHTHDRAARPAPRQALAAILALSLIAAASPAVAAGVGRMGTGVECPSCDPVAQLGEARFTKPTKIDHKYLPLEPGTQLVLQGQADRGGGLLPHLVIFTVTDLVKVIDGVPCVVVWDQDINEGVLSESELAFFAQDDEGNVWNLGEYPEVYENGVFVHAEDTWVHGVEDAQAGVTVRGDPVVGSPGYLQAFAPENDFWDCGIVYEQPNVRTCLPFGCYKDALVVREWSPFDGCDVIQVKTYAKGVGVVEIGAIGDPEAETLILVQVNRLTKQEMLEVRRNAYALETRAYIVSWIYGHTPPLQVDLPGLAVGRHDAEVQEAPPAPSHVFLSVAPNPVSASASIAYSLSQAGPVQLAIFDVAGRMVRSLVDETASPGAYRVQWDARDADGQGVATGIYFARLRTGTQLVRKTIVVAR